MVELLEQSKRIKKEIGEKAYKLYKKLAISLINEKYEMADKIRNQILEL